MRIILWISLVITLLNGCSGIKMIEPDRTDIYSKPFLTKVDQIKRDYSEGKIEIALTQLNALDDKSITPIEKAFKYNLIGVIYFSENKFDQSIAYFKTALETATEDPALEAQINLNLGSTYYKLDDYPQALLSLQIVVDEKLSQTERRKLYYLGYVIGKKIKNDELTLTSLAKLLGEKFSLSEFQQDPLYDKLVQSFLQLNFNQRARFLEKFGDAQSVAIGYLSFLHIERSMVELERDAVIEMLDDVLSKYSKFPGLTHVARNFKLSLENLSKLNTNAIGVVLPFSDKKKKFFAERVMLGIDSALQQFSSGEANPNGGALTSPILYTKDSLGSGVVGANAVKELIQKHYVAAIIGGLFPDEATKEYLEAKKHGVLFISLSQVFLPKEQKNHLLIEIPGSIESQVAALLSEDMLARFGKRVGVLYPQSERGEAYVNEFWRASEAKGLRVTGIQSFDEKATDFRDPVQKLLGLKFKREREEELELLASIHKLQGRRSVRRLQTLTPKVDFDWIFIPAFPNEAVQLIPAFSYYDAFDVNFFGGPSWRSKILSKQSKSSKYGQIFFIGDDINPRSSEFNEFRKKFWENYNRQARLIESMAFDGLKLIYDIFYRQREDISSRELLNSKIKRAAVLSGLTGSWSFKDGIWLKSMHPLSLKRGKVEKVGELTAVESN